MTRKEYVVQVTNELLETPKVFLQGHGMKPNLLAAIAKRPDVLAKLATIGFNSKLFKRGAKAVRKSKVLKITAYRNFADLNFQAREDVETFQSTLPEADAATFNNDENILVFVVLNDETSEDVENDIANGKSIALPFNSAITKQYKIPGGMYVCVMFGDSYVNPAAARNAKAKEKINKRVQARRSPSKVRAELTNKAKAKLKAIDAKTKELSFKAEKTAAQLQQVAALGKVAGVNQFENASELVKGIRAFNTKNKDLIKSLDSGDLSLYKKAVSLYKKGKTTEANRILAEIAIPELTELVRSGNVTSTSVASIKRVKEFKAKIKEINAKNAELLVKMEEAPTAKLRANIRFAIAKNVKNVKILRARIAAHSDVKITSVAAKMRMLNSTNAEIINYLEKGKTTSEALALALEKLPVSAQVKQQISQQVMQHVSQEIPMQYAVQQAIQQVVAVTQDIPQEIDETVQQILDDEELIDDATTLSSEMENFEYSLDDEDLEDPEFIFDEELDSVSSSLLGTKSIADILKAL